MIGWLFILELTSQCIKCNPIQTTLRLLWTQVSGWIIHYIQEIGMTFLLFPILHDLAEFLGFGRIYFICPMVLASAMQTEFFFLALLKATRMLMKGLFRSRCSRWDYSLICIPLGDRSSMMKSFAFHIRSFHSSILLGVTPPMRNALHSSLVCAEPKKQHGPSRGPLGSPGALSGKWGLVLWEII